jgi:hypothetical protein
VGGAGPVSAFLDDVSLWNLHEHIAQKMKATGSLCAKAKTHHMQLAEQKQVSLPCAHVEVGDFLANPRGSGPALETSE